MNKTENIVAYRDLGEVRFVKNPRARNLTIRINRNGEIRVTIPRYGNRRKAEAFLHSKRGWILGKQRDLRSLKEEGRLPEPGEAVRVRGKAIPLILSGRDETTEEAVWRILLIEAKAYLPGRVRLLAERHGFRISGIRIRKMRSRWGSCSARNGINLNSWLVMLPDHLSDYVILHELVHTRHKDHSNAFWSALDRVTGGRAKQLRKELRDYRIMHFPSANTHSGPMQDSRQGRLWDQ